MATYFESIETFPDDCKHFSENLEQLFNERLHTKAFEIGLEEGRDYFYELLIPMLTNPYYSEQSRILFLNKPTRTSYMNYLRKFQRDQYLIIINIFSKNNLAFVSEHITNVARYLHQAYTEEKFNHLELCMRIAIDYLTVNNYSKESFQMVDISPVLMTYLLSHYSGASLTIVLTLFDIMLLSDEFLETISNEEIVIIGAIFCLFSNYTRLFVIIDPIIKKFFEKKKTAVAKSTKAILRMKGGFLVETQEMKDYMKEINQRNDYTYWCEPDAPFCEKCQTKDRVLSRCSRCKKVLYCSSTCQRLNWAEHKKICKA